MMMTDTLLNLDEVAAKLGLPRKAVRVLIRRGDLAAVVFPNEIRRGSLPAQMIRVEASALAAFLEACRR